MTCSIGERLKKLRDNFNLTQKEVAHICSISRSTYANYENNNNYPPQHVQITLCNYYHVTLDYLNCIADLDQPANIIDSEFNVNYKSIPLVRPNLDVIKYILTPKEKVLHGKYSYIYSPCDYLESKILKNNLLLIQIQEFFNNGDIILLKYNDTLYIGKGIFSKGVLILHNSSLFKSSFLLISNSSYNVIGLIKEVTFNL